MKISLILFFVLTWISAKSFATYSNVTVDSGSVSNVIYPSTISGVATDNIVIFGGSTGAPTASGYFGDCDTYTGSGTCNSCTAMTDLVAPTYFRCAYRNVTKNTVMRISFTMDAVPEGAVLKAQWKETSGTPLSTNAPAIVAGQTTVTAEVKWLDICNAATVGAAGCSGGVFDDAFLDTLMVGVILNSDSLTSANSMKFTVKWHHMNADVATAAATLPVPVPTTVTACPGSGGSEDPFCYFKVLPGDSKVYISDLVRGSIGPPNDASGIKWQYVRVFHANITECALPCAPGAINFANIPLGSGAQYEDLMITDKANVATQLSTNKVSSGFQNEVDYKFNIATVDESTIVDGFLDPAGLDGINHATRPGEVIGLLDDKHCFIATAAFGSEMAPQVDTLRKFRHRFLLSNSWGRSFVRFYYKYSPPVAEFISQHDLLRTLVRGALWPVIFLASWANQVGGA